MISKKEMHQQNTSRGVNIPQLNSAQMRQVGVGSKDLFEDELSPILEKIMPDDNWNRRLHSKEHMKNQCIEFANISSQQLDEIRDIYAESKK
jgi:hypothetical protein